MSKLLATSSRASGTMLATTDQRRFTRLQCARLLLGLIIVVSLSHVVHFGLSVSWILLGTIAGGVLSGRFLLSGRSFLQTAAAHLLFFCLLAGILALANITVVAQAGSAPQSDFLIPRYADDIFLVCLFYTASFLSTWFFWTNAQAVTFEALFGTSIFVWLLSAHRNYHIDAPKQISSLAWKAEFLQHHQIEPQHLFLGIGALVAAVLVIYFCLASNRPIIGRPAALKSFGKTQSFAALLCILAVLAGFAYYAKYVNTRYSTDLSRVTSGVGMDQNLAEGESNLGFHQAISPTRQPAALLRLENDFKKNPWQPMLYLREGALSAFNGRELVSAGLQFDRDVPKIGIGQPYITAEDELPGASEREKVVQSVYLLTKHTAPFAIDIPQKISVLRNPDPQRFLSAYQVSSFAPTMPAVNLVGKAVGDSSWPEEVWDHYLRAPGSLSPQADLTGALDAEEPVFDVQREDLRYLATAKRLTEATDDLVTKAAMIVHYLSQESIYTRTPGHQTSEQGDPVAPYLFSKEKRGYCVHFAHAAAYMMRLLGIPARIATGYLVDLTYAKDGHILLQLGDRHAWPEVYVEGQGWTVFDVTPARAENEPTLVPDEHLLEDLMSKLTPPEALLEPMPLEEPRSAEKEMLVHVLTSQNFRGALLALLLAFFLAKLALRFGYLALPQGAGRNKLAYISFASTMADLGLARLAGETKHEFAARLQEAHRVDARLITSVMERTKYAEFPPGLLRHELSAAIRAAARSYDHTHLRLKRWLALISPLSLRRLGSW